MEFRLTLCIGDGKGEPPPLTIKGGVEDLLTALEEEVTNDAGVVMGAGFTLTVERTQ